MNFLKEEANLLKKSQNIDEKLTIFAIYCDIYFKYECDKYPYLGKKLKNYFFNTVEELKNKQQITKEEFLNTFASYMDYYFYEEDESYNYFLEEKIDYYSEVNLIKEKNEQGLGAQILATIEEEGTKYQLDFEDKANIVYTFKKDLNQILKEYKKENNIKDITKSKEKALKEANDNLTEDLRPLLSRYSKNQAYLNYQLEAVLKTRFINALQSKKINVRIRKIRA